MTQLIRFFTALLLCDTLFAETNSTEIPPPTRKEYNIPAPTGSKSAEGKNISDWEAWSKQHGVDESLIGNSQDLARKMYGEGALNPNVNQVNDQYIKSQSEYKNNKAITAFDETIKSKIIEHSSSGAIGSNVAAKDIKCYITRDIPFRYRCNLTGLLYGGAVNETGKVARNTCESECYETKTCINVTSSSTPESKSSTHAGMTKEISSTNTILFSLPLDSTRKIKKVNFTTESESDTPFYVDVTYVDLKNKEVKLVYRLRSGKAKDARAFVLEDTAKSIAFKAYTDDGATVKASLTDVIVSYAGNEKFICPALQDISHERPENYAKLCPSGIIHTFTKGSSVYKICQDYGVLGDNPDGTFSSADTCISNCKRAGNCEADATTFTTEILKNFREGCIQGQANCKDEDCALARKKGDKIFHEVVFDAGKTPWITIQNTTQVKGVKRPRISVLDDEDYLKRHANEWKDEAYTNMLREKTYNFSSVKIGDKTKSSSAYGLGVSSGAAYGVSAMATRTLSWNLKPSSTDVSNGKRYYLYAVLIAEIGKSEWQPSGAKDIQRDRVWYVKTQKDGDKFKAFRREINVGGSGMDSNGSIHFFENQYAEKRYETFSEGWFGISPSMMAEAFDNVEFRPAGSPFWTFSLVGNLGALVENLPGIVRSRSKDLYERPFYTGSFDGSGDGILDYVVATYYSPTPLTYADLVSKISSGEITIMYRGNNPSVFPATVKSDSQNATTSYINIYQYGASSSQSAYMRILPRSEDVGKKGFIYVFIY